ncbi:hypothetical protein HDV00_010835 [Rhizophlyctis rosea]|nr:hypothetical protein HDV00_010835 [Rhizophlyctis rosea]
MKVIAAAATTLLLLQSVSAQTLKSVAEANGKYFGTIIDTGYLSDSTYTGIATREFDYVTPENSMKWESIEPGNNQFSWNGGDAVVNWATSNGLKVRGHTLVWHSQLPSWVANGSWSKTTLSNVIVNHVKTIVTRYKGKLAQWDVVNEIFNEDGSARDSVFSRTFGNLDDFVTLAFNTARAADPDVKLCINDYNLDYSGAKANAMISLVKRLKANGVPIDCIGSQAHLIVGQVSSSFKSTLQSLCSTAGACALTELDIRTNTPASSSALQQQKTDYQNVVNACATTSTCWGVSVWGITDSRSWIPGVFSGQGAALPWDNNYSKKPAYDGAIAGFPSVTSRTTTTTTTTRTTTTTTQTPITTTTQGGNTCAVTSTVTVAPETVTLTSTNTVTVTVGGTQPTTTTTTQGNTGGSCSAQWGQCGGQGWQGPTCCSSGTCRAQNTYYSQCI